MLQATYAFWIVLRVLQGILQYVADHLSDVELNRRSLKWSVTVPYVCRMICKLDSGHLSDLAIYQGYLTNVQQHNESPSDLYICSLVQFYKISSELTGYIR